MRHASSIYPFTDLTIAREPHDSCNILRFVFTPLRAAQSSIPVPVLWFQPEFKAWERGCKVWVCRLAHLTSLRKQTLRTGGRTPLLVHVVPDPERAQWPRKRPQVSRTVVYLYKFLDP